MFRYYFKDPDGDLTEITDRIRIGAQELAESAEEGAVGSGSVSVDDILGDFNIRGHRLFLVIEDTALADDFGGCVYFGYTFNRGVGRKVVTDSERRERARQWTVNLEDVNTLLSDRILHGAGNKRPAETDIERVTWLLGQAEVGRVLNDLTFVASGDGVDMDGDVDYTRQTPLEVLDDCAQQSGRNYFLLWQDSGSSIPDVYLWYRHGTGSFWQANIRISNVLSEINGFDTFAPSMDSALDRDPSRVYSDILQDYDGGYVVESKQATRDRFRIRWAPGKAENVKTATKARHRARRYLNDLDTELDIITTAVLLPRAQVNDAMAGQLMDVHFSHLPGYEDGFVSMRIVDRTVREINPELVEVALTLEGESPAEGDTTETSGNAFGVLDYAHNQGYGVFDIRFEAVGDAPPIGWVTQPTVGLLTALSDADPRPFYGFQVDGDGTVDVRFTCTVAGVSDAGQTFTIVWAITLNGAEVATESVTTPLVTAYYTQGNSVFATGLAVSNGDIIGARVSVGPNIMPFFTVPAGTGTGSEQLEISNGDLS